MIKNVPAIVTILMLISAAASGLAFAQQPTVGGTLVWAVMTEPPHLNPLIAYVHQLTFVGLQVYDSPLWFDEKWNPVKGGLADSWEISGDKLSYTLRLVKNAKWHDGKPVTSEDVKFSSEAYVQYHPLGTTMKPYIDGIDSKDPYTITYRLKKPYPGFLLSMFGGGTAMFVLPKHIYEGTDVTKNPANLKPIGSGPFRFVEWKKGEQIVLERNPNYWKEGKPYLEKIVFRFIPDSTTKAIAFEQGEVDLMSHDGFPYQDASRLKSVKGSKISEISALTRPMMIWLQPNLQDPVLKDVRVRKALTYAIDRKFIVDSAYLGFGKVQDSYLHPAAFGYSADVTKFEYDPAKAEKMLDEAGYVKKTDGKRFSLKPLITIRFSERVRAAEIIVESFKKVGVEISYVPYESYATQRDFARSRPSDWSFAITGMTTGPDSIAASSRLIVTGGADNWGKYDNKEVTTSISAAASEVNENKVRELLATAQKKVAEDVYVFPLTPHPFWTAFREDMFANIPVRDGAPLTDVYYKPIAQTSPTLPLEWLVASSIALLVAVAAWIGLRMRKKPGKPVTSPASSTS